MLTSARFVCLAILAAFPPTPSLCQTPASVAATLDWAYPAAPPAPLPEAPPGTYSVPGSNLKFTAAQVNAHAPDWFPNEHPPAPTVVVEGRSQGPEACGQCHNYNGVGFIGIPDLAGLPASYIIEQVGEFRAGRRQSSQPNRPGTRIMAEMARAVTDSDLKLAAGYFASLPRRQWYRVVQAAMVPTTTANYYGWRELDKSGGSEAIAGRIVEVAEDSQRMFWLSDPHSGVIVYVPLDAPTRGEALARGGAGVQPCTSCHGPALKGAGNVPPLAGRSAAYLARQICDIRTGARGGPSVALMRPVATSLGPQQITEVAAYLSSLPP